MGKIARRLLQWTIRMVEKLVADKKAERHATWRRDTDISNMIDSLHRRIGELRQEQKNIDATIQVINNEIAHLESQLNLLNSVEI